MDLNLSNDRIRQLIPNVIREVQGETPLCDKLLPWISTAMQWLSGYIIGPDFDLPEQLTPLVEKIVVNIAFAEAIPSLDLSLTPAGFSVISTDGRAPASKERVERLIDSVWSSADANLQVLVDKLLLIPDWVKTPMGQWWMATFIPAISTAFRFRSDSRLYDTYVSIRSIALRFEQALAESYLGSELLDDLRSRQISESEDNEIISMIRQAEIRYISSHISDRKVSCPNEHEVWHLIRPVIDRLKFFPDIFAIWKSQMGDKFHPDPFKNDIKGAFYF